jgi:hypothetical protein
MHFHPPRLPSQFFPPPWSGSQPTISAHTANGERSCQHYLQTATGGRRSREEEEEGARTRKKDRKKAEDELVKAIYRQSLEAEVREKQRQKELKKEKK